MFGGAIALSIGLIAAGLSGRLSDFFSRSSTIVLLVVLVACSLVLVVLRRRAPGAYLPPRSGPETEFDGTGGTGAGSSQRGSTARPQGTGPETEEHTRP